MGGIGTLTTKRKNKEKHKETHLAQETKTRIFAA